MYRLLIVYSGDPRKAYNEFRHFIPGSSNNLVNPVLLVLLLAIRTGDLPCLCIDEVIQWALKRPDRRIKWVDETRPVFPRFYADGTFDVEQPMMSKYGKKILQLIRRLLCPNRRL